MKDKKSNFERVYEKMKEVESNGSLVTEIAELQRQIDERDRLLEHIFFVLNGDVTRRIMRTDVPLAAQIVDLLVEWQIKNKKHSAPQSGL